MGIFKKSWKELKERRAYRKAAEKQTRKKAEAAYYKARMEERIKYAKNKARIEREAEEKRLKARYAPKKPIGEMVRTFVSQQRGYTPQPYFKSGGLVSPLFGQPKKPPKTIRKRKSKKKTRQKKSGYIIRGGKAYPIA